MAKSKQQILKKKLDEIFSKYIRLYNANEYGYCRCYTCPKQGYWKADGIQNGHYIPRNILATRFEPDNCKPQCIGCNLFGNGKFIDFRIHLVEDIGEEKVTELEQKKFTTVKYDVNWYEEKISYYKEQVKELLNAKDSEQKGL